MPVLKLERHHDFQICISPKNNKVTGINPPSFNWPQDLENRYSLELESLDKKSHWKWKGVSSPFQLPFLLDVGRYRWRLCNADAIESTWFTFTVDRYAENYLPPTAKQLFDLTQGRNQFLLYFDEDIEAIQLQAQDAYAKLKETVKRVDLDAIVYPNHYRRGKEEEKRKAVHHVREWIDRDLMALTLLYKIWNDKAAGSKAVDLLLRFMEWNPEGPASLIQPCIWGDEVGLSLSRNVYLAYHWLSPLLHEAEKNFIRPTLIRIVHQMEERLEQDKFKQYPGNSHTSRLPAYLGIAALALHREYNEKICQRWLDYSLMIYRGILPFYGGDDGSWVEGPFYSASYTKWHHPFFLAVERLSDFSFYNHPFYKNYDKFALDFVTSDDTIHPFGDGFWCKRDGLEWPGFFAQNPLRIYAERFGNQESRELCRKLEDEIQWYQLHVLDVIPTIKQLEFVKRNLLVENQKDTEISKKQYMKYYGFAGLGKASLSHVDCYFRASQFGNSSHRHGDQGNIVLIDAGKGVLVPSGSFGYRFGSGHHTAWTRTTRAHNLPVIGGLGQILDDQSGVARVLKMQAESEWIFIQLDLANAYSNVNKFTRNIILIRDKGLIICDTMQLPEAHAIKWHLHSHVQATEKEHVVHLQDTEHHYKVKMISHASIQPTVTEGYEKDTTHSEPIVSDATDNVYHMEWNIGKGKEHVIVACCTKEPLQVTCKNQKVLKIATDTELIRIEI